LTILKVIVYIRKILNYVLPLSFIKVPLLRTKDTCVFVPFYYLNYGCLPLFCLAPFNYRPLPFVLNNRLVLSTSILISRLANIR